MSGRRGSGRRASVTSLGSSRVWPSGIGAWGMFLAEVDGFDAVRVGVDLVGVGGVVDSVVVESA